MKKLLVITIVLCFCGVAWALVAPMNPSQLRTRGLLKVEWQTKDLTKSGNECDITYDYLGGKWDWICYKVPFHTGTNDFIVTFTNFENQILTSDIAITETSSCAMGGLWGNYTVK